MLNQEITLNAISKVVRIIVKEELQPFRNEITEFKSEVLNSQDRLMKELKTIREEQIAKVGRDDDQDQKISELKIEFKSIKQHIGFAPAVS